MNTETINNPRAEIDAIDGEILRLLNERARIALRVGAAKTSVETSLCDPTREEEVLKRLCDENAGPFDETSIGNIFQRIIDESLQLQQKTYYKTADSDGKSGYALPESGSRVAFLGERGTFSEEAALAILGENCRTVSFPTFEALFGAIDAQKVEYILAPLENSLIGSVQRCVDLLLESSLYIVAETLLPVSHFLVACPEATLDTIQTVESHPAALAQCRRFFAAHPHLKRLEGNDTAGSVRRAVESGDVTRAAIGGPRTAEIYGGKVLREHLEDHRENYTRFVLLSSKADDAAQRDKVSLVLRLKNVPGALHGALRPFVRRGIDLLKIESLPLREMPGEFYFYLDVLSPANRGEMRGALDELDTIAEDVRNLGCYSTINITTAKLNL